MQWREFTLKQLGIMHLWQVQPGHVQQWIELPHAKGNEQAHDNRTAGRRQLVLRILHGPDLYVRRQSSISLHRCLRQPAPKPVHGEHHRPPQSSAVFWRHDGATGRFRWFITDLTERNAERPCSREPAQPRPVADVRVEWMAQRRSDHDDVGQGRGKQSSRRTVSPTDGLARPVTARRRSGLCPQWHTTPLLPISNIEGRWNPGGPGHIGDDEYIWQPLRIAGCANFANVDGLAANRHITQCTANGILQSLLRRYFIHVARETGMEKAPSRDWATKEAQSIPSTALRHMFAKQLYKANGQILSMVKDEAGTQIVGDDANLSA